MPDAEDPDARGHAIAELLEELFRRESGLTRSDKLYAAARRTARGRQLRVTKELVQDWIAGEGRHQTYTEKANR